jgi:hypothetical protein
MVPSLPGNSADHVRPPCLRCFTPNIVPRPIHSNRVRSAHRFSEFLQGERETIARAVTVDASQHRRGRERVALDGKCSRISAQLTVPLNIESMNYDMGGGQWVVCGVHVLNDGYPYVSQPVLGGPSSTAFAVGTVEHTFWVLLGKYERLNDRTLQCEGISGRARKLLSIIRFANGIAKWKLDQRDLLDF